MKTYHTAAEVDAAFARGENAFIYAPVGPEPTPADAPHQPGDIVYLTEVSFINHNHVPTDLINKPLTVVSCTRAPVDDADLWDIELLRPDGREVEYLVTHDQVSTSPPFYPQPHTTT